MFRLPIYLYRLNLGWLLGHRFLLLTHQGRKSGLPQQAVLEVILYDPATRESVVLPGREKQADWYLNIQARPALDVYTGRKRYVPEQRFLAPEENHAAITEYAQLHPLAFRFLIKAFGFGYPLNGTGSADIGRRRIPVHTGKSTSGGVRPGLRSSGHCAPGAAAVQCDLVPVRNETGLPFDL